MDNDAKSRVDSAVPRHAAQELSEDEKRALEIGGQIEHQQGEQREKAAQEADDLANDQK